MRRVPDILPVSMQDILYGRQSDLRAEEIIRFIEKIETAVFRSLFLVVFIFK